MKGNVSKQKGNSNGISWDVHQNKGNRIYYQRAFGYLGYTDIDPKYIIKPTGSNFIQAFQGSHVRNVNWSKFDFSECGSFSETFNSTPFLSDIGYDAKGNPIDGFELAPTSPLANVWNYTFGGTAATKIQKLVPQLTHQFNSSFSRCANLEEIRFAPYDAEKGIGIANNISFADSPKLTRESIVSILEALADNLSATKTLTFSSDLYFESKMLDPVFGRFSDNVMESREGTINGLEYRLSWDEIYLNGTATAETHFNLCNTPIAFPEWRYSMSLQFCDCYNGRLNDWLRLTVQKADGSTETLFAYQSNGYSVGCYESGDTITSIDLVIPAGETYSEYLGGISLNIDYLYWIEETLLYRTCWNIIY